MKLHWIAVITLICLVAGDLATAQASAPAKALSPMEEALIANEKAFLAAAMKGDAGFFKQTLAEDFSFVGSDGQLAQRQEMIDQMSGGGVNLQPYNMKVISVDERAAIITYDVILRIPPEEDQGPPPRYQHWSSVWVKQGDGWKLKFQQTTPTHWGDW